MKKITAFMLVFMIVLLTACSLNEQEPTEPSAVAAEQQVETLSIALRGYSGKYPENTRQAFVGAFSEGFDGVECEVWESANGDLMVNRDFSITRLTGVKKYIWNINSKNRDKYPLKKGNGIENYESGTVLIPTLEEVCRIVSDYDGYIYLNIRTSEKHNRGFSSVAAKKVLKLLKKYDLTEKALIFSTGGASLGDFADGNVSLGAYSNPKSRDDIEASVALCRKNVLNAIILKNMDAVMLYDDSRKLVKHCEKNGLSLCVYSAGGAEEFGFFKDIGVTAAFSSEKVTE